MVALTGVEPAKSQFSSVQLGLSSCVFGLVQFETRAFRAVRMADVLPRCCPAARIRLLAGQSNNPADRLARKFLARVIQPPRSVRGHDRARQRKTRWRWPIITINALYKADCRDRRPFRRHLSSDRPSWNCRRSTRQTL